jgi:hypothetical protein
VTLPPGIPAEIATVHADPSYFAEDSNPLADASQGTVLEDLASIDGCWGAYRRIEYQDNQSGPINVLERWAAMKFDSRADTLALEILEKLPADRHPVPMLLIYTGPYELLSDNRVRWHITQVEGGDVNPSGDVQFDVMTTIIGETSYDTDGVMLVTLQGDALKTVEIDPNAEASSVLYDELTFSGGRWRRLDCGK